LWPIRALSTWRPLRRHIKEEHVPLAVARLAGKTKIVATKVLSPPQGTPPFYRVAEIYFPSMTALETCAASPGAKKALDHAAKISTGGPPVIMIAEEETFTFESHVSV
jgi:uncharacterized protein (TIGR02118 family)